MISVVIPIYNRHVTHLVSQLHTQLVASGIPFEILAIEDGSDRLKAANNESLKKIPGVRYIVNMVNKGRSAIRNELASTARFDNLLYLDCDSELIHPEYISKYLSLKEHEVIYGGTSYPANSLGDDYHLHEQFGKLREALTANIRNKNPWVSFKTNNFMIRKEIVLKFPFDESITKYGYEDLVFANDLKEAGISILHIDNEVLHTGLEANEFFLEKTEKSIENLAMLYSAEKVQSTALIKAYKSLYLFIRMLEISGLLNRLIKSLKLNLTVKKRSLYYFDLWKLLVFYKKQKSLPEIR